MLRKPIYAGRISLSCWCGVETRGSFLPIVSEPTFERVQAVLSGRRTVKESREREHGDFPLRHFVRCSNCNLPLTASWSRGRSQKYPYYRCRRTQCKVTVSKS